MRKNQFNRREWLKQAGVGILSAEAMSGERVATVSAAPVGKSKLSLLKKEIFLPCQDGKNVMPEFITYIHKQNPVLIHRFCLEDYSDAYDNFQEQVSEDNGETWSKPALKFQGYNVPEGRIRYGENAGFFDADTGKLLTFVNRSLYPKDQLNEEVPIQVEITVYDPLAEKLPPPFTADFGLAGGIAVSFTFPIKTTKGRLIVPTMKAVVDENGKTQRHPRSGMVVYEVRMILGDTQTDGTLKWKVGQALQADPKRVSRGFSESTVVELADGRLALLIRGSNAGMPDVPGYKWLSFSTDAGETWSKAVPLSCHDGTLIESSATGSAAFRSIKTGKLYWIGNLCKEGEHADGNWPRSPLIIAELQEEPLAIKKDTITVIDERGQKDSPQTQISNFRYYQDRKTGEVVLFASRLGERDAVKWQWADYYRYRIAIA